MFRQKCFGYIWGLRYGSTTLALTQYEASTTPFGRSKYILAQTTFRQLTDKLNYIYIYQQKTAQRRFGRRPVVTRGGVLPVSHLVSRADTTVLCGGRASLWGK